MTPIDCSIAAAPAELIIQGFIQDFTTGGRGRGPVWGFPQSPLASLS